jgi:hypothetical protein
MKMLTIVCQEKFEDTVLVPFNNEGGSRVHSDGLGGW